MLNTPDRSRDTLLDAWTHDQRDKVGGQVPLKSLYINHVLSVDPDANYLSSSLPVLEVPNE